MHLFRFPAACAVESLRYQHHGLFLRSRLDVRPFGSGRKRRRHIRCHYRQPALCTAGGTEKCGRYRGDGKPQPLKEALKGQYDAYTGTADLYVYFFERSLQLLRDRYDQGKYFWELRSCSYWTEFEQPKIVFPDIAISSEFSWDSENYCLANTAYLLLGEKWVLSILNSNAVLWFYNQISNAIRGGYLRFIRQYVE